MLPIFSTLKTDTAYSFESLVSTQETTRFHNSDDDSINRYFFLKQHNPLVFEI
jgi:hypothetical protein